MQWPSSILIARGRTISSIFDLILIPQAFRLCPTSSRIFRRGNRTTCRRRPRIWTKVASICSKRRSSTTRPNGKALRPSERLRAYAFFLNRQRSSFSRLRSSFNRLRSSFSRLRQFLRESQLTLPAQQDFRESDVEPSLLFLARQIYAPGSQRRQRVNVGRFSASAPSEFSTRPNQINRPDHTGLRRGRFSRRSIKNYIVNSSASHLSTTTTSTTTTTTTLSNWNSRSPSPEISVNILDQIATIVSARLLFWVCMNGIILPTYTTPCVKIISLKQYSVELNRVRPCFILSYPFVD